MKRSNQLVMALTLSAMPLLATAQVPFTLSTSLTNGTFVRSVTTADVNGDGRPDLISVREIPVFCMFGPIVETVSSFPMPAIASALSLIRSSLPM